MQVDTDAFTDVSSSITSKEPLPPTLRSSLRKSKSKAAPPRNDLPPIIHPSLDSYKFKVVVEISANVTKTDKVYPTLREQILAGLSFIHEFGDPTAAFLPKPDSDRIIPIYDGTSFPADQFTTGMHFFVYQNDYSLFPIKTESRWIRLSVNMGFNQDPASFLHIMKIDLMGLGATYEVKQQQALTTCTNIVFLGAPQFINKSYAKEVMDRHLIPLETQLMAEDPFTYPECVHGRVWPSYSLVIEQPSGMFEPVAKGMKRVPPPKERRSLQLLCAAEDYDRLAALIKAAKTRGVWTSEFGNGQCFPVEVPDNDSSKLVKDNYKLMVETHASAQLGMGHDTFSGVKDDRVEREIQRLPDAKGPRSPITITLRHVLRRMQFKGYPLWVCLIRTDKKQGFDIFYDGQCPITTSYVTEFLKCPAAQIMFWLLKRGFMKAQVEEFLTATFNLEQLTLCSRARYNPEVKLAQVRTAEEDMDILTASQRKGSKIHTDLGLTPDRIKIRQAQLAATVCNLGKFDFSSPQDLRTVRGNASSGEWSKEASLGKSIYQLGPGGNSDSTTEHDDDDDDGAHDDDHSNDEVQVDGASTMDGRDSLQRQVQFSMDIPGGTVSDRISLPAARGLLAPLFFPGVDVERLAVTGVSTDMQGVETEVHETPSGIFAQSLWNLAPENYRLLFFILDQLEREILQSRNLSFPAMDIPNEVHGLITDDLRQKLVAGAGDVEFLDFVDTIRSAFEELKAADVSARMDLDELFRKRPRGEGEDDEVYELDDDPNGTKQDGHLTDGLPRSSAASSLQTAAAGGTVIPQGSLLSAPAVASPDASSEVETSPAGGGSG